MSAAELEQAARTLSCMEFGQEFEADITAVGGWVYQDFNLEPWPHGNIDTTADDLGGEPEPPEDPRMTRPDPAEVSQIASAVSSRLSRSGPPRIGSRCMSGGTPG